MSKTMCLAAVICTAMWLQSAAPAAAQGYGGYYPQAQNASPYNQGYGNVPTYTPPAVSPYLNLGVNANGLSNYQTLVRPMIDEQENLQRQSANLQKLQRQVRDTQNRKDPRGTAASSDGSQPVGRFMHYSHYYNTGR